jgi:hypothetical protein
MLNASSTNSSEVCSRIWRLSGAQLHTEIPAASYLRLAPGNLPRGFANK